MCMQGKWQGTTQESMEEKQPGTRQVCARQVVTNEGRMYKRKTQS